MLEAATGAELMRSGALRRPDQTQPCAVAVAASGAAVAALAWPDRLQVFAVPWSAAEPQILATFDIAVRFKDDAINPSMRTVVLLVCCTAILLTHSTATCQSVEDHRSVMLWFAGGAAQEEAAGGIGGAQAASAPACVAFGPPSQRVVAFATPLRPGQLLLYDWRQQCIIRTVLLDPLWPSATVISVAASPCGRLLAAATAGSTFVLCSHAVAEVVQFADREVGEAHRVLTFCGGGRRLLMSRGGAVELWDTTAALRQADLLLGVASARC